MANDASHYRELAALALAEANCASLDNVRDRALRSAAAFEAMAQHSERTTEQRVKREAEAAERASGLLTQSAAQ